MSSLKSNYAESKTGVFWDIEDCPIPNGLDPVSVCRNIKSALANQGYRGEVSITAYKEKKPIRNDFELAGINLQIAGDKHGRSKCMLDDFFPWVLDNRDGTNMLVISRDKAYLANYLGKTVAENHNILLAESEDPPEKCCKCGVALDKPPPISDKRDLVGEEWVWTSLAFGGDPIIKTKKQ